MAKVEPKQIDFFGTARLADAGGESMIEAATAGQERLEVIVSDRPGEQNVRARVAFAMGERLADFRARATFAEPARMTLQVAVDRHIEMDPAFLKYVNHSCEPNAFFDAELGALVALRPIAPGEEVTFFYPATEWTIADPFECACGKPGCLGQITGALRIDRTRLGAYRLAPYIVRLLEAAERKAGPVAT